MHWHNFCKVKCRHLQPKASTENLSSQIDSIDSKILSDEPRDVIEKEV